MQHIDWVTPAQIADLADVPVGVVRYHLRVSKTLLGFKRGRDWQIRSDEARRWIEEYQPYLTRRPRQ